ncbi:hypothetical protein BCR35DRAFT_354765 [Leucosporidium creatinivorum]|uniref:Uncharacterized protein n=1 Tax=Leucosporidium creatinivorum TaxID=106004 RepID=A0A1Y2EAQ9_9BASI|nr:hypothetical protein BCR35DRAFT_354765 [Leucosporidium creatinivorum]
MNDSLPAPPSAKAEQLVSADRDSSAKDLLFDDSDYDSDFPESKAAPAVVPAETYTLSDVLALVQEGLSQNAHNHSQLLDRFNTLERNLSKRIAAQEHVETSPSASAPSSPVPSLTELIEKKRESIAKLKETNVTLTDADVTFVKSFQSQLRDATATFETDVKALITEFSSPARSSPAARSPHIDVVEVVKLTDDVHSTASTRELLSPSPKPKRAAANAPPSPIASPAGSVDDGNEVYFPCDTVDHAKVVEEPSDNSSGKDEVDIYADMPPLIALTPLEEQRLTGFSPFHPSTRTTPFKLFFVDGAAPAVVSSDAQLPSAPSSSAPSCPVQSKPTSPSHSSSQLSLAEIEKQRSAMDRLSLTIRSLAIPPSTSPITAQAHGSPPAAEHEHVQVPATKSLASFIKHSFIKQSLAEKDLEKEAPLPAVADSRVSQSEEQATYLASITTAGAEVRLQDQARQLYITERVLARREKLLARKQAHLDAETVRLEMRKAEMDRQKAELEQREKEWQMKQHAKLVSMREQMAKLRELVLEHEEQKRATEIPPAPEDTAGDDYFKLLRRVESDSARKECERLTQLRDAALTKLKEAIAEEESEMERID